MNYKNAFIAVLVLVMISFATMAQTYISEDFENVSSGLPSGWSSLGTGSVAVHSGNAHGGSHSMRFSGATSNVVVLPELPVQVNTTQVTLWTKAEQNSSFCGSFQVGYLTNVNDANTFVAVETISYEDYTTYRELTVPMSNAPAGARIAFRHRPEYSYYYWYCDDVTVEALPSCMPVTNLFALPGYNGVILSWSDAENSNNYTVYNMTTGDVLVTNLHAQTYTVQNLTPSTAYTFGVVSNCSATEVSPMAMINTQTTCMAFAVPFSESFEGGDIPVCWTQNGDWTWHVGTGDHLASTGAHTGTHNVLVTSDTYSGTSKLITPKLNLSNLSAPVHLSFWHIQRSWYGDYDHLKVYYRTSDNASWVLLDNYANPIESWTEEMITLPELSSTYQIAFEFQAGWGYGVAIDDILIDAPSSCSRVTNLTAIPTSNSVTLDWTDEQNSAATYTIYDATTGDVIATNCSGNSYTVSGLNAATSYSFSVVANCSAGESSMPTTINVQTECGVFSIPFLEDFNNLHSGIPTCWDHNEGTTTFSSYKWNYFAGGYSGAGLRFNSYVNAIGHTNVLSTPPVTINENAILMFWCKNPDGGDFSVSASVDSSDTRNTLVTNLTAINDWMLVSLPLDSATYTGHDVTIYFQGTSNYGHNDAYIYLDEVSIVSVSQAACMRAVPYVYGFEDADELDCWTVHATTPFTGRFDNTVGENALEGTAYFAFSTHWATPPQYLVSPELMGTGHGLQLSFSFKAYNAIHPESFVVGYSTTTNDTSAFVWGTEVANLSNTTYERYIENIAVDGIKYVAIKYTTANRLALFIDSVVIDELPSCPSVNHLLVDSVGSTSVSLSWMSNASSYTVMNDTIQIATGITDTHFTVTGLTPATSYSFSVIANCSDSVASEAVSKSVITDCDVFELPYRESFEADGDYDCWTVYATNQQTGLLEFGDYAESGTSVFVFDTAFTLPQYLISPELTGTEHGVKLSFSYMSFASSNSDSFVVGYSTTTNDTNAFVWSSVVTGIPFYFYDRFATDIHVSEVKYVAIKSFNATNALYIDSLVIDVMPSCLPVTNLNFGNATTTSVTLSWTDVLNDGATYTIYNMADTSVVATNINDTYYTITGLYPSAMITYAVVANCSEDDASSAVTIDAMTACEAIELPYTENFEADGNYNCWTVHATSSFTGRMDLFVYAENGVGFFAFANSVNPPQYLISPGLTDTGAGVQLEFGYRAMASFFAESFVVGYSTTTNDTSAFVWGTEVTDITNSTYARYVEEMETVGIKYVAIKYTAYDKSSLLIDSLVISKLPTNCMPVTNLLVDDIGATDVTLTWEDQDNIDATYSVLYVSGDEFITDTTGLTETTYTVQGLTPSTLYHFMIRTDCEDTTAYSNDLVVTTQAQQSISSLEGTSKWKLYPNPANTKVTVEAEGMNRVVVLDAAGHEVESRQVNGNKEHFDVSKLNSGIYFFRIESSDNMTVRKCVISH